MKWSQPTLHGAVTSPGPADVRVCHVGCSACGNMSAVAWFPVNMLSFQAY